MTEIKRWDYTYGGLETSIDGDYVLYTDHMAALEAVKVTVKPEMVAVSTTDVDHNGDHIEKEITRAEWEVSTDFEARVFEILTPTQPEPTGGQSE